MWEYTTETFKMPQETMSKFKSRVAAMIQNTFSALPETMPDNYFHICTSKAFNDITGKLINDKREVMQSSTEAKNSLNRY